MLITDRKDRSFAFVNLDDIIVSMEKGNLKEKSLLKPLFLMENLNERNNIRIKKNSEEYKILKKYVKEGDYYINPSMLADSYTRASLEFNYEMKDRIFKYLKKYIDNLRENKTNEKLVQKILCDDKVMDYTYKYDNFEDYTKHIIGTRIKQKEEKKVENKSKSFVRIVS